MQSGILLCNILDEFVCVGVCICVCVCGCMYEYVRSARTLAEAQTTIIIYQEPLHIAGNYFDIRTVRTRAQQYIYTTKNRHARGHSYAAVARPRRLRNFFVHYLCIHIFYISIHTWACATRPGMSESDTDFVVCKVRSLANLSLLMSVWCVCV